MVTERRTILSSFCILCKSVSIVRKKVGGFAFSLCWTTNSWREKECQGHHMELSSSGLMFPSVGVTTTADEFTAWINGHKGGGRDGKMDEWINTEMIDWWMDKRRNGRMGALWYSNQLMDYWMIGRMDKHSWIDEWTDTRMSRCYRWMDGWMEDG